MKNRKMTHNHKCIVKAYNETNGQLKINRSPRSEQKNSSDLPLFKQDQPTLFDNPDDETSGLYDFCPVALQIAAEEIGCNPDELRSLEISELWDITDNIV